MFLSMTAKWIGIVVVDPNNIIRWIWIESKHLKTKVKDNLNTYIFSFKF